MTEISAKTILVILIGLAVATYLTISISERRESSNYHLQSDDISNSLPKPTSPSRNTFIRADEGVQSNNTFMRADEGVQSINTFIRADEGVHSDKWIVVTSIQSPTKTVRDLAKIPGWKLLVVGDTKTPKDWKLNGTIYLGVERQKTLGYATIRHLPYRSYTRKVIGYLYAIQHGAKFIYDTDDDNVPWDNLSTFHLTDTADVLMVNTKKLVFNHYAHFGQASMWPRGFPVEHFASSSEFHDYESRKMQAPVVQQGLIDGDPDVDAVYRMTRKNNKEKLRIKFDPSGPPVALPEQTFAPFNSQNTLFTYDGFWALLIPVSTTFRTCDIYRGYWSQPLVWSIGKHIGFYPPNSVHIRNAHSYIDDAKQETDFIRMGDLLEEVKTWTCTKSQFSDCIMDFTQKFVQMKFYSDKELRLVDAWLEDLKALGYKFPSVVAQPQKQIKPKLKFKYFIKGMPASMPHTTEYYMTQNGLGLNQTVGYMKETCPQNSVSKYLYNMRNAQEVLLDTLLVIYNTPNLDVLAKQESYYRLKRLFPRRVYCTKEDGIPWKWYNEWELSVVLLPNDKSSEYDCLSASMKLGFVVKGYLFVHNSEVLINDQVISKYNFNSTRNLKKIEKYIVDKCTRGKSSMDLCVDNNIIPTQQQGKLANEVRSDLHYLVKCTHSQQIFFPGEVKQPRNQDIFYLPEKYKASFLYFKDFEKFSIISVLCLNYALIPTMSSIKVNVTGNNFCDRF